MTHFQANYSLAGEAVPNVLQNLGQLLGGLERVVPLPGDLALSLIHMLGLPCLCPARQTGKAPNVSPVAERHGRCPGPVAWLR